MNNPDFQKVKITWIISLPVKEVVPIINLLSRHIHTVEVSCEYLREKK